MCESYSSLHRSLASEGTGAVTDGADPKRWGDHLLSSRWFRGRLGCGSLGSALRQLGSILRTRFPALVHPRRIEGASHDMVANPGQIFDTTAAHEHNRVLLKVMPFTRNVGGYFDAGRQTYPGDFAQRRVRLFRRHRPDLHTHASTLGGRFQRWGLGLAMQRLTSNTNQLADRWHVELQDTRIADCGCGTTLRTPN